MKKIGIIGSTGSIGTQALDVVRRNPGKFQIVFLCCNSNTQLLADQTAEFGPKFSCSAQGCYSDGKKIDGLTVSDIIYNEELDLVLLAAVGAAGAVYAFDTVKRGITLALANKESIVASGRLLTSLAREKNVRIIPVDSEHSAIFQCLEGQDRHYLHKITLTASGGSFRNTPKDAMQYVTLEQALRHPNWSMGTKITVDSATMMNKGLELIEARYLFDVNPEMLDVVIHTQSVIHSFISFTDGSMLAQMGKPDMRTPISYAFGWPERLKSGVEPLDLSEVGLLSFKKPDMEKYPCLKTAIEVLKKDRNAPMIVMNAANEIAVSEFIWSRIRFTDIAAVIDSVLSSYVPDEPSCFEEVLEIDSISREKAKEAVKGFYK